MNTSTEAVRQLQEARKTTWAGIQVMNDLVVEHEYQDVATLVAQAAAALLESAALLMQSNDEEALNALEKADNLLDSVYAIIDGETDEEES